MGYLITSVSFGWLESCTGVAHMCGTWLKPVCAPAFLRCPYTCPMSVDSLVLRLHLQMLAQPYILRSLLRLHMLAIAVARSMISNNVAGGIIEWGEAWPLAFNNAPYACVWTTGKVDEYGSVVYKHGTHLYIRQQCGSGCRTRRPWLRRVVVFCGSGTPRLGRHCYRQEGVCATASKGLLVCIVRAATHISRCELWLARRTVDTRHMRNQTQWCVRMHARCCLAVCGRCWLGLTSVHVMLCWFRVCCCIGSCAGDLPCAKPLTSHRLVYCAAPSRIAA